MTIFNLRAPAAAQMSALAAMLVFASFSDVLAQNDPRIAQAKEKGKVTWYTTVYPTKLLDALVDAFQKRTGLQLSTYVGGGGQVISRLLMERQAGAYNVDVVDAGSVDIEDLIKDGVLKTYTPKGAEMIHADFKDPRGYYYGLMFWALVLEYNTNFYNKDTAPKSFKDLANPKFKGKVVTADPARSTGGRGFIKAMVASEGWEWVEQFVQNDPLVMSITSGIQPVVVTGERPIAVMTSDFASKTMAEGGPIALATNEALFGSPQVLGILKDAPNPVGAELLVEFLLSKDAQKMIAPFGPYGARTDVAAPYGMPAIADIMFRYKRIPDISMSSKDIADRFNRLLRAKK